MTDELAKKKRQLDHENMETQTAQVRLLCYYILMLPFLFLPYLTMVFVTLP